MMTEEEQVLQEIDKKIIRDLRLQLTALKRDYRQQRFYARSSSGALLALLVLALVLQWLYG